MNEVRLNISACYEDAGWVTSYVKIAPEINDGWTKKFGDCRSAMEHLNAKEAFRLMKTELGSYISYIIPNKACSRNGLIQISLFVPVGKQIDNGQDLDTILKNIADCFPKDSDKLKSFFAKEPSELEDFKRNVNKMVLDISTEEDYKIEGLDMNFSVESSAIAYRRYKDKTELDAYLSKPNQQAYTQYASVFFISNEYRPDESCKEIKDRLQSIISVENLPDKYYMLEGSQIDIVLNKYRAEEDIFPKTLTIVADHKAGKGYDSNAGRIYVDEDKIDFYRTITVKLNPPVKADDNLIPLLTVSTKDGEVKEINGNIVEETPDSKEWKYIFEKAYVANDYSINIKSDDVCLKKDTVMFNPLDSKEISIDLEYKRRNVLFEFEYNQKEIAGIRCRLIDEKNDKMSIFSSQRVTLVKDKIYKLKLESDNYDLENEDVEISLASISSKGTYRVKLKNKPFILYTKIHGIRLSGETSEINIDDRKYHDFKFYKKSEKSAKIKVVPYKWKVLSYMFMILSFVLIIAAAVVLFMYCDINKIIPLKQQKTELIDNKNSSETEVNTSHTDTVSEIETTSTENSQVVH